MLKSTILYSNLLLRCTLVIALLGLSTAAFSSDTRTGNFAGLNNHTTTGGVTVEKTTDGYVITLGADFNFDGAPDPKVALGTNGKYDPSTLIEPLRSNTGEQTYKVPASISVENFNEVYIWCEKYSVGLGVATLQ